MKILHFIALFAGCFFRPWLRLRFFLLALLLPATLPAQNPPLDDSQPLRLPRVGDHQLRLLSSNLLELLLITTKQPDPAPVTQWNFVDANGNFTPPAPAHFVVTANGQAVPVQTVGFKRRVLYAPLQYDLRIANSLYLRLANAISSSNVLLQVRNPSTNLWSTNMVFTLAVNPLRYSPALHVNQVGYLPAFPKKATIGYYLGSFGELSVPASPGFQLISTQNSNSVYSGTLVPRQDVGYLYTPTPYQQVLEADFSALQTPGQYKLVVPGLGASLPFLIHEGVAATFARTYGLGIYHQRCGTSNALPFTRFIHEPCHTNPAQVPTLASPEFDFANYIVNELSAVAANNPQETAPRMTNVLASLYPFVNQGSVNVRGGHHDAGDYSKYTINVAMLIHYLVFAVDAFPGVKDLDNLGIPESGDGISDLLQEAKWEADFLVKMQDADGGFYFLVYPKNRQYEDNVLPEHGDPQIVLPKTTSASAAAVAALAEIGSSPAFKAVYPAAASSYLAKAQAGWDFLQQAISDHGRTGSFQSLSTLGDTFLHDDELAWAAAALYSATGTKAYDTDLRTYTPNPNDPSVRRWGWYSMWGPYGCAFRDYAFAARTGRLNANKLNATYLAQCVAELKTAATNALTFSANNAYGSSFPDENKPLMTAGWYFSSEQAFDPAVAYLLDPQPAYLDVVLRNFNYELGCNPLNSTFVTGLGSKRQRVIVNQYAENDHRVLPPSGIPTGNIQQGFVWLNAYGAALGELTFPSDGAASAPYPMYDRWADAWNTITEFVVSQQSGRALGTAAWLMAMTSIKTQAWKSATAWISGLPPLIPTSQMVTGAVAVAGLDLSQALVVWDALGQEPYLGASFPFTPGNLGTNRVEVEAQWPDGRRVFAATNFYALPPSLPPLATNSDMVALYRLTSDFSDATGQQSNLIPRGTAAVDLIGLHVQGLGNNVFVNLPNSAIFNPTNTQAVSVEARVYINHYNPLGLGQGYPLGLVQNLNRQLELYQDTWKPLPDVYGGLQLLLSGNILTNHLTFQQWHVLNVALTKTGYVISVDGNPIFSNTSTDLSTWLSSGSALLQAGDFDGWIQNLVVRNVRAPRITGMATLPSGAFRLSFSGMVGISYTVQASTNLASWTAIGAAAQTVPGTFQFTDNGATNIRARYYRVRIP